MNKKHQADARRVACLTCGAAPGERCLTGKGKRTSDWHLIRINKASRMREAIA